MRPGQSYPRNLLSDAAWLRVDSAHLEAELLRTRALADLSARYHAEGEPGDCFGDYLDRGNAALEWRKAKMDGVRLVLRACLDGYSAAGLSGNELRACIREEIEGAVNSNELNKSDQNLLTLEFHRDLYPGHYAPIEVVTGGSSSSGQVPPFDELGIPIAERKRLLDAYQADLKVSDRRIYTARNKPAGHKEFKAWKNGTLPRASATTIAIERFLRDRVHPT